MSITLPDPSPSLHTSSAAAAGAGAAATTSSHQPTRPRSLKHSICCYFGVYPHGMSNEGQVTRILSQEHLDSMLAQTDEICASA